MQPSPPTENSVPQKRSAGWNPFFPMVVLSATIFIITILAMIAVIFSDPNAPVAKFMDAHSGRLIAAEVVVTLAVGLLALIVDRLQYRGQRFSRRERPEESAQRMPAKSEKT